MIDDFEAIKKRDTKVYDSLFRKYYVPLCRYALSFVGDEDVAQEIVQNVFIRLWEKKEQINITSSLNAYLYRATRNVSINQIKKDTFRLNFESESAQYNENEDIDLEREARMYFAINEAIDNLPKKCREIFLLSRNYELKNKEIANQLNVSVKTVENQITIAFKKLREALLPLMKKLNVLFFIYIFRGIQ